MKLWVLSVNVWVVKGLWNENMKLQRIVRVEKGEWEKVAKEGVELIEQD